MLRVVIQYSYFNNKSLPNLFTANNLAYPTFSLRYQPPLQQVTNAPLSRLLLCLCVKSCYPIFIFRSTTKIYPTFLTAKTLSFPTFSLRYQPPLQQIMNAPLSRLLLCLHEERRMVFLSTNLKTKISKFSVLQEGVLTSFNLAR